MKQYVEKLNGEISVKSLEGLGTQFKLSLPIEIADQANDDSSLPEIKSKAPLEKPIRSNASSAPSEQNQFKILLMEDNPMAMQVASGMLKKHSFDIHQAFTANEAFTAFEEKEFDVILTDIGLPDLSGFELAKKISASNISSSPIIGLTAHAKQQASLEGQQSGMVEVFEKPLSPEKIQILLSHISKGKRPEEKTKEASTPLPLIDEELAISYLGSQDELKEMLEIMLYQSMSETTSLIEKAYQEQNLDELKKAANKFKSSCLYCATTLLPHYTQKLEGLAANQDTSELKQTYHEFQEALKATKEHIEQWILNH